MDESTRQLYLESQVRTATPQRLRLMLIEGAIRFTRQAQQAYRKGDNETALEAIIRARSIVSELLGVFQSSNKDLDDRVRAIYIFLFQHLTSAQLQRNGDMLEDVAKILEVERQTWTQLCEQEPRAPDPADVRKNAPAEITARDVVAVAPPAHQRSNALRGFSIDA